MEKIIHHKGLYVCIVLLLILNIFFIYKFFFPRKVQTSSILPFQETDIPVTFRTEGGLLEVAGMTKYENLLREDSLKWWFVSLGTTVSQIRVEATYRYHVKLSGAWKVRIKDTLCIVEAPQFEPTLPVAIDTAKTVHKTERGWARFNEDENLELLGKSISENLKDRSRRPEYLNLVREPARKTVEEFIATWLLREKLWEDSEWHMIKVIFPDEKNGAYKIGVVEVEPAIDGIKKISRSPSSINQYLKRGASK
jgi:hypothetical protein